MKLPDHVDHIRTLINKAFDNQFSRLGLGPAKMLEIEKIPQEFHSKREKLDVLITSHTGEFGNYKEAREKALDELTFTLFNRLAAVKVMESLHLFPPVVTKQPEHGDRSFGHKIWLEENPEMRSEELEGLRQYFKDEFNKLGETIPLFHKSYPYAFLPYIIDFNEIITAFNAVELDSQIDPEIWQSDDILGWLYESYNNSKKAAHKASKAKTEYDKVSLQSQVYTPRWVVEFLVNNSLGKLYLEMYPDSEIKDRYKIANVPETAIREIKPLHEIKMIDPASGSGNFLLYGFELFYELYLDQIENYGADYEEDELPKLIIENNLHGIDLDDRAIQLAQLGLWIKAKQKRRTIDELNFNIVSSDFYLPDFVFVEPIFKTGTTDTKQLSVIEDIWADLQQVHKFGSLVKIEEKLSLKLHGLLDQTGPTLFGEQELEEYERFKSSFLRNLETAISRFAIQQGNSFLTDKTKDAITFLKLLTTKYDVVAANPPYTDSSNFGDELKQFVENNYKTPYKFHTNLYASFIKRCLELSVANGRVAMVHPPTFMYIKTFEDVRKYILTKTHIELFVEWGYLGMFHPSARVDSAMYILNKEINDEEIETSFIKLNHLYEGKRYLNFKKAYDHLLNGEVSNNVYFLPQSKLKVIKSWPFIYWISDKFRKQFQKETVENICKVCEGFKSNDNLKILRFFWEFNSPYKPLPDHFLFTKGGPYNKWYGNNWLILKWTENGKNLREKGASLTSQQFYFQEGLTYNKASVKGNSFRLLDKNVIFDSSSPSLFILKQRMNLLYLMAVLNSKLIHYILFCLNPTVSSQVGDLKRVPLVKSPLEDKIRDLVELILNNKKELQSFSLLEPFFEENPIQRFQENSLKDRIKSFLDFENFLQAQIILFEAVINEYIFEIYELSPQDEEMVLLQEGDNLGSLPLTSEAKEAFLDELKIRDDFSIAEIENYVKALPVMNYNSDEQEKVLTAFPSLYNSNNDLEEFCQNYVVNPVNVWYWFKEANVIPQQRKNDLVLEFLVDLIRELLMEDEDGIIPLVPNAGEKDLLNRVEEKFMEKSFSRSQYSSFDSLLGKDLKEYFNSSFFKDFTDHLNLFQHLSKTPFIWHLSSGPEKAFDCYIIIYKWSRDKLLRIRSVYIENRERSLVNRQSDLARDESAKAQNEKETIYKQLKELEGFKKKIDELLQEGYDPILDDGVGKNIAPLQAKGMLPYDVLNPGQLDKYLNADW